MRIGFKNLIWIFITILDRYLLMKMLYICKVCGYESVKWFGRCPQCQSWNSSEQIRSDRISQKTRHREIPKAQRLSEVSSLSDKRIRTPFSEFDRTLGGGIVPGSLVLIGGDPGIGKSTLLLQVCGCVSDRDIKTLYVSGEESPQQIKLRAERLKIDSRELYILSSTTIEEIEENIERLSPQLLVIDSVQTMRSEALPSAPGSISQISEVTSRIQRISKERHICTFIIGHVTKHGAIAGPKALEHMVDTVLYFEGDTYYTYRILRTAKNRFGPSNEIGVFEMSGEGLKEVINPSSIFIHERRPGDSGSSVVPCMEGTRPILVEIQSLVSPNRVGMPRRTTIGLDPNRASLLIAIISKRLGIDMHDHDIFLNVVGGLRVDEPAADLSVIASLLSSFMERAIREGISLFGEVGLAGEVRGVVHPDLRIREAEKLGFREIILPKSNLQSLSFRGDIKLFGISHIKEIVKKIF